MILKQPEIVKCATCGSPHSVGHILYGCDHCGTEMGTYGLRITVMYEDGTTDSDRVERYEFCSWNHLRRFLLLHEFKRPIQFITLPQVWGTQSEFSQFLDILKP